MHALNYEVQSWIERWELQKWERTFADQDLTSLDLIATLTKEDLLCLGIHTVGGRRRVSNAIQALNTDSAKRKVPYADAPELMFSCGGSGGAISSVSSVNSEECTQLTDSEVNGLKQVISDLQTVVAQKDKLLFETSQLLALKDKRISELEAQLLAATPISSLPRLEPVSPPKQAPVLLSGGPKSRRLEPVLKPEVSPGEEKGTKDSKSSLVTTDDLAETLLECTASSPADTPEKSQTTLPKPSKVRKGTATSDLSRPSTAPVKRSSAKTANTQAGSLQDTSVWNYEQGPEADSATSSVFQTCPSRYHRNSFVDRQIVQSHKEAETLASVFEFAEALLNDEKEQSATTSFELQEMIVKGNSSDIDVGFFKKRIQGRLKKWEAESSLKLKESETKTKPRTQTMAKAELANLMNEQQRNMAGLEVQNKLYDRMVDMCIQRHNALARKRRVIGDFRDETEFNLKVKLCEQIGKDIDVPESPVKIRSVSADVKQEKQTWLEEEMVKLLEAVDVNSDGILSFEELQAATEKDSELRTKLKTLGANVAILRMKNDNEHVQAIVDKIDINGDGILSLEELQQIAEDDQERLRAMGIVLDGL